MSCSYVAKTFQSYLAAVVLLQSGDGAAVAIAAIEPEPSFVRRAQLLSV
jgi:hypothetical protein